ncbi:MAG: sialate O-acetylesterase [Lacunisphaera sp.]
MSVTGFWGGVTAVGKVSLPAIFGDHMVLQQGSPLSVWGWADSGEPVRVAWGREERCTVTDAEGKWRVDLPPLAGSTEPGTLRVRGSNEVLFTDVLISDVWLCSGQSNMFFPLRQAEGGAAAIAAANHPAMRLFLVPRRISWTSQADLAGVHRASEGHWIVCRPDDPAVAEFSAVGFFFGRQLLAERGQPIGLISSAYGGSPAEAWMSEPALAADLRLAHYAGEFEQMKRDLPHAEAEYFAHVLPEWQARQAALASAPAQPGAANRAPRPPLVPGSNQRVPVVLFNGMIAPLVPFGLKGVIWYQGESNAVTEAQALEYKTLFPALIADWRSRWNRPELPFLYVQLSAFSTPQPWPLLRQAQLEALAVPHTGMAVSIDVGAEHDIHPRNKEVIGQRLARLALHEVYGGEGAYSGPLLASLARQGNRLRLKFDQVGGGLVTGGNAADAGKPVEGFSVAGTDGEYLAAEAVIEGDTVAVWNRSIRDPASVRYGWASYPRVNLYNRDGLPASPFIATLEP